MKKFQFILSPLVFAVIGFFFLAYSGGTAASGSGDSTGSPGSNNTCGNCHNGGSFGTSITATIKDQTGSIVTAYIPGENYTIEYQVSSTSGTPNYGFQSVALSAVNVNAGFFDSALTVNTQISSFGSRLLPEHSSLSSTGNFKVRWVAPPSGTGDVTFYYMGNTVNNNNNTSGDQSTPTISLTLTETPVFRVRLTQTISIICYAGSNATLRAQVYVGQAPYRFVWSNGATSGNTYNSTHQITAIPFGNYSVTVTDAANNVAISNYQITQPDSIKTTFTVIEPTCFSASNGNINSTTIGGVSPYLKTWNTGSNSGTLTNIDTGNYQITITDANGCLGTDAIHLSSPNITPYIEPNPDTLLCTTGWTVTYNAGNLTSGYNYLWSTGETSFAINITEYGEYWLRATNSLNCQGFDTAYIDFCIAVSENKPLEVSLITFPNPANETLFLESTENGEIQLFSSLGKRVFQTEIQKGNSNIHIDKLPSGIYLLVFSTPEKITTKRIIIN